jgi:hypothetical protein
VSFNQTDNSDSSVPEEDYETYKKDALKRKATLEQE